MAGAAALCGAAALRSGAGLVRVATPAEVQPTVASFEPSYMTYPLPCDDNGLIQFAPAQPVLERLIEPADVVAVGPGLGQSDDIRELVKFLITATDKPLVIDADGLNALVGQTDLLSALNRPVVLTPHPGEFARLTGDDGRGSPGGPSRAGRRTGRALGAARRGPQGGRHRRDRRHGGITSTPPATPAWPPAARATS